MTKIMSILMMIVSIIGASENIELTEIYSEFTETVTVQYSKTIRVKQTQVNIKQDSSLNDIVYYWNNVVNSRDTVALFNLYAPYVLYYGKEMSDKSCIQDKRNFYRKYPFFSQSVDNLETVKIDENLYKVYFDKFVKMKEGSEAKNYPSYLLIGYYEGTAYIFVEGDSITDKNLLKKRFR